MSSFRWEEVTPLRGSRLRRIGWETHIGDAHGKIALWLDEQGAQDLRDLLHPADRLRDELDDALKKAYPE